MVTPCTMQVSGTTAGIPAYQLTYTRGISAEVAKWMGKTLMMKLLCLSAFLT
jgi:hypothetical protein